MGGGQEVGRIYVTIGIKNDMNGQLSAITAGLNNLNKVGSNVGQNIGKNLSNSFKQVGKVAADAGNSISKGFGSTLLNSLKSLSSKVSSFGSSIANAFSKSFPNLSSKISSALSGAKSGFQTLKTVATSAFDGIVTAGKRVYQQIGFIGTALAAAFTQKLASAISTSLSVFQKFDDQMRKVQAVTESSGQQFQQLTDQAKLLGATTSFTAQEVAEGMTLLGQAGFSANQVIAAMPATLNLARASMTDLGTTADIMSNIMNGFQIAAEDTTRVSDVLSKAANATNTDVTGLGQAMKYVAPLAHQMSWSLEETAAAAGLLSNAGIKGSMAGTVLRNSISRLLSPTAKAEGILKSYGITIDAISPKTHSFAQIIDILAQSGMSAGDVMQVFGMRAGPGILAMLNIGTGAINNMNQTLMNSAGYAQKAADMMDAGWGGAVRRFGDAIEALQLTFGKAFATMLTPFVNAISAVGVAISRLPAPIIYLTSAFAMAGVAAGALLVSFAALPTVIGILSAGLGAVATVFTSVALALDGTAISATASSIALAAATAPISTIAVTVGGAIAAITALGLALWGLEQKTKVFSNSWQMLQDAWTIGTFYAQKAFDGLKDAVSDAIDSILASLKRLGDSTGLTKFVDGVINTYDRIKTALGGYKDSLHETAETIRTEEERQAEGAANVQKQIQRAHEGTAASYKTVDKATGQTYASMIEAAESGASGVEGANNEIMSSNSELVGSFGEVQEAASKPIKLTMDQTNVSGIANFNSARALSSNPLNSSVDELNKGLKLADGNLLKMGSSGDFVLQTIDGVETSVKDVREETTRAKDVTTTYGSVIKDVSNGIKLASGNMLKMRDNGDLVIVTANGIEKSLEDAQAESEKSAEGAKLYASSLLEVFKGVKGVDGSTLRWSKDNGGLIESVGGITQRYEDVYKIMNDANDLNFKFADSYDQIVDGIQLADGSMLSFNESGEASITTVDGLTQSVADLQKQMEFASSMAGQSSVLTFDNIQEGIELADGSMLTFNESGELVIKTLDGVIKKASELGSTSFQTADEKTIDVIGGPGTTGSGAPTKTISLAEAKQASEDLTGYPDTPEGRAARWADATGHTVVLADQKMDTRSLTKQEQAHVDSGEWTKPITSMPDTSGKQARNGTELNIEVAKDNNLTPEQAGTIPRTETLSDAYKERLKQQKVEDSGQSWYDKAKSKTETWISSATLAPLGNRKSQWDITKEQYGNTKKWIKDHTPSSFGALNDRFGITKPMKGTENISAASFGSGFKLPDLSSLSNIKLPDLSKLEMPKLPDISGFVSNLLKMSGIKLPDISNIKLPSFSDITSTLSSLPSTISSVLGGIPSTISSILSNVPSTISSILGNIPSTVSSILGNVPSTVSSILGNIPSTISSLLGSIPSTISSLLGSIPGTISSILGSVPSTVSSILSSLPSTVSSILGSIPSTVSSILGSIPSVVSSILGSVPSTVSSIIGSVPGIISSILSSIPGIVSSILSSVPPTVSSIFGQLPGIASSILSSIPGIVSSILGRIPGIVSSVLGSLPSVISSIFGQIPPTISSILGKVPSLIMSHASSFYNAGVAVVQKLIDGLSSKLSAVKSKVSEIVSAASISGSANSIAKSASNSISSAGKWVVNSATTVAQKVADLFPHSPAKAGPFRKLPNWDAVFLNPMKKSIAGANQLVLPLSQMLSTIQAPLNAASSRNAMLSAQTRYGNYKMGSTSNSQKMISGSTTKINTINDYGTKLSATMLKKAGL